MSQEPPDLTGKMIGEYYVVSRLGAGGMGVVYEGRHPLIGKRVAVKVLMPHLAKQKQPVDRFLDEARSVNEIRHRGIVDIFGFGQMPSGLYYLVMEFLDGQSFDTLIETASPIPLRDVLQFMVEILDALDAAHRAGVIHRDLKPSNIFLVDSGRERPYVKLLDFGVAKLGVLEGEATPQTRQSVVVGTPEYISPEQARGQPVSTRTDLYALGVVMFELLTGRRPFVAENPLQTMWMHVEAAVPRASDFREDLPREIDELIMWMMKKELNERPESAAVLRAHVQAIRSIFVTDPAATVVPPPPQIMPVAMPRHNSARSLPAVALADEPPPATTPHALAQTSEEPPTQPPITKPRSRAPLTESGLPEPEYLADDSHGGPAATPSALEMPPVQDPSDEADTTGVHEVDEMDWKIDHQHPGGGPPSAPVSRLVVGLLSAAVVVLLLVVGLLASRLAAQPIAVEPPTAEPEKAAEPDKPAEAPKAAPAPKLAAPPAPVLPARDAEVAVDAGARPEEAQAPEPVPEAPKAAGPSEETKRKALARAIRKASEGKAAKAAAAEAKPADEQPDSTPPDVAPARVEPVKVEAPQPEPAAPAEGTAP